MHGVTTIYSFIYSVNNLLLNICFLKSISVSNMNGHVSNKCAFHYASWAVEALSAKN